MSSLVAWDMELLPTKRLFWMRLLHGGGGRRGQRTRACARVGEHVQAGHGRPVRARACHRWWLGAAGHTHSESVALLLPSKPSFTLS
jgi:hypothetical protein